MIDIHTHLYFPQYDTDRIDTLKRAFDVGLDMMISVSTSPSDHQKALSIAAMDERVFAAVGLHPHHFNDHGVDDLEKDILELRDLANGNSKIVAIGECGLDYFSHTDAPVTEEQKRWQKEGFEAQVRLAQELGLPMILHCRDAYEDVLEVIREIGGRTKFILHCYMGDVEVTEKFLTISNVYFSFTGNITYPVKKVFDGTKDDIRETVKLIPLERLFTETDCPFLAPVPYRGERNEPLYVAEVVKKVAELHRISVQEVSDAVSRNKDALFG